MAVVDTIVGALFTVMFTVQLPAQPLPSVKLYVSVCVPAPGSKVLPVTPVPLQVPWSMPFAVPLRVTSASLSQYGP